MQCKVEIRPEKPIDRKVLPQGVIAAARNAGDIDIWSGILMIAAVAILLLPLLAIPFIFGGFKAKKLKPKLSPELLKVGFHLSKGASLLHLCPEVPVWRILKDLAWWSKKLAKAAAIMTVQKKEVGTLHPNP